MKHHNDSQSPPRLRTPAVLLSLALAAVLLAACSSSSDPGAKPNQELVIGSQMASFPSLDTAAATSAGYEGQRLVGNLVYEGLTKRDVSDPNSPAGLAPALAKSWEISSDGLKNTLQLQEGVQFIDETPFNADAVVYNIERYIDKSHPQHDPQFITYYPVLAYVKSVQKVDDLTVMFTLTKPFAFFLADLYNVYIASPTSLSKDGSAGQAKNPVGTGPFVFDYLNENQSISFVKNADYWGTVPKLDRITVELIPDAAARTAALLSGRVDWIEAAQPDDFAALESKGFVTTGNSFDWEWSWQLMTDQEPLDDVRVRQAMNYAIDRESIANDLLHGTATPAYQMLAPASLFYDKADDIYSYDPEKAKALLAEAGYADGIDVTVGYITAGSGSMQSKPMNEALQAQLAEVGIRVTLEPVDFSGMYGKLLGGPTGWHAANVPFSMEQPSSWGFTLQCGVSLFGYCNEDFEKLWDQALVTTDDDERASLLTRATSAATKDAAWLFVVNDTAPRAMSNAVKGYTQPKSWWIEFNDVSMG